jgi:hypothetical protein
MYKNNFVPENFKIPEQLETDKFRLRMLTIDDVDKDYEAVMSSVEHLKGTFGPVHIVGDIGDWPENDLTLKQDLIDLGWHQREFQDRSSFTFTVMNLDESQCLGCVYILPSENPNYDVMVILWVRQSEHENNLDEKLFIAVKNWIKEKWPFRNVAYPGRDIAWKEFINK